MNRIIIIILLFVYLICGAGLLSSSGFQFSNNICITNASTDLSENDKKIISSGFEKDERDIIRLPIVMYHSILHNKKGTYIVSEKQLECDLIAFKNAGFTTVFPSEIIDFVKTGKILPPKPMLITFDDGHYNNLYYALPLLKKYNIKALIDIIGKFSNHSTVSGDHSKIEYSHLTWSQIHELYSSGHFEVGNHSYGMHNYKPRFGISQKNGESDEQYRKILTEDIGLLQEKLKTFVGVTPKVFAYPFGKYCDNAKKILVEMGFEMFLTCNEGVSNIHKFKPKSISLLKRINRSGYYTTQELLSKINTM
jgi:peptidoglycan/xylan/chitin deacetylase (PgdA/CDA1 family)